MDTIHDSNYKKQFETINDQLKQLYEDLYSNINGLDKIIKQDREKLNAYKAEKDELTEHNDRLLEENKRQKNQIHELQQSIDVLKKENNDLKKHIDDFNKKERYAKVVPFDTGNCFEKNIKPKFGLQVKKFTQPKIDIPRYDLNFIKGYAYNGLRYLAQEPTEHWEHTSALLINWFIFSRYSNLYPIFCGYDAVYIVRTIIASIYGEKPEIITLNPDFNDVAVLSECLKEADTRNVIIDGIDGINLTVLLPILRKYMGKKLIFIIEDFSQIKMMPSFMMNYCCLISYKGQALNEEYNPPFYHLNTELNYKGNEYMTTDTEEFIDILHHMGLNTTYCQVRNTIYQLMMPQKDKNKEKYKDKYKWAIKQYYNAELRWIINDKQAAVFKSFLKKKQFNDNEINNLII